MNITKRKKQWNIDSIEKYSLSEGIEKVKENALKSFNESIDLVIRLGVDPRKGDQLVRGTCTLPHGTGKVVRVLVFAKGEKETLAKKAGADYVGGADLVEKIQGGWLEFERVVASPDMMIHVGKIGKILGPRGLMPNPKTGTVTPNVADAVKSIKQGQVQFRVDKGANLHIPVGKTNFSVEQLKENIETIYDSILKLKPATAKGSYVKNISISSTMGPGIKIQL